MSEWIAPLVSGIVGAVAGSGGTLTLYAKLRELRDRREEGEIGRLRQDLAALTDRDRKCAAEVEALKARVTLVEHHHGGYLARWFKDATKRVTWINDKAFLSIFAAIGLTRDEVIGSTFSDLLDPLAAAEIDRLDAAALAHPDQPASNVIQLHPLLPVMVVVKVAAIGRSGELVFEGYAYRTNDRALAEGMGADRQRQAIEASAHHLTGGDE